jgi:predicted nucleic acid-binding protein
VLFETRYFWAVFTAKDAETVGKLRGLYERSETPYASSVSVYEVCKQTLATEDVRVAEIRARTMANEFTVVDVDAEIAEEGAKIGNRLRTPMADSLIMATAKRLRVPCVTDDPHFTEVKRVWIGRE